MTTRVAWYIIIGFALLLGMHLGFAGWWWGVVLLALGFVILTLSACLGITYKAYRSVSELVLSLMKQLEES